MAPETRNVGFRPQIARMDTEAVSSPSGMDSDDNESPVSEADHGNRTAGGNGLQCSGFPGMLP